MPLWGDWWQTFLLKWNQVMYVLLDCFVVHLICKRNLIWVEQPFLFLHYIITMLNYCMGERGLQWDYLLTTHTKYKYSFLGVLPHVPRMLPVLISDPVMRQKVEDTFTSQEFLDNLEGYFVDNIKVSFLYIYTQTSI